MQTASVQVYQQEDACDVRVDGIVSAHLVADLRRLSGTARQTRIDLRGAWVSTEGVEALRSWHLAAPGRLELVLPAALTVAPADLGADAGQPEGAHDTPVDLPDLLAHEVRGPLAIAHLRLQTLAARLAGTGQADEATNCESAIASLEAVGRLLDTYLTASRPWKARPLELGDVCTTAAEALRDLAPDCKITVCRNPVGAEFWLDGERQAIQQLVWNLLRNGLEAAGPDGAVALDISASDRERRAVLRVGDDGPGFPAAILAAPFQRRRSDKTGGMGIGLVLCRWIVERHGGTITLANGRHGGIVTVELPCDAGRE